MPVFTFPGNVSLSAAVQSEFQALSAQPANKSIAAETLRLTALITVLDTANGAPQPVTSANASTAGMPNPPVPNTTLAQIKATPEYQAQLKKALAGLPATEGLLAYRLYSGSVPTQEELNYWMGNMDAAFPV